MPRWAVLLPLAFLLGCSGPTKLVRLDTGQGTPLVHTPRRDVEPVEWDEDALQETVVEHARLVQPATRPLEHARQLFGVPQRSGWYGYEGRSRQLTLLGPEEDQKLELSPADAELKRGYLSWCERTWGPGDCLRLLVDSPVLDGDGKYALAMAIAHGAVLEAMKEEFGRMVSPTAVVATLIGALTMYAVLLALPEPVSKGVAALMTVGAVAYLGWDTVWRLIDGWLVLMKEVDRATTFEELQASGERLGAVMGERAARAFVMLATVALGSTTAGMATKLPKLPGAGQATVMAEAQLGIRYSAKALVQVESVALHAGGATIALGPNAVAMTAQDQPPRAGGPGEWVQVNEHMSESARNYQAQVTGAPQGYAYRIATNGEEADFDGFTDGVLVDAKGPNYAKFFDNELKALGFFKGDVKMLKDARRQLRVANGTPIKWIVAEEKFAAALRLLFAKNGVGIEVVHVPPV